MANPGELLRSAAENKRRRPEKAMQEKNAGDFPAAVQEEAVYVRPLSRPHTGHSAYSALMRSHDRVRPRIGR